MIVDCSLITHLQQLSCLNQTPKTTTSSLDLICAQRSYLHFIAYNEGFYRKAFCTGFFLVVSMAIVLPHISFTYITGQFRLHFWWDFVVHFLSETSVPFRNKLFTINQSRERNKNVIAVQVTVQVFFTCHVNIFVEFFFSGFLSFDN